MARVRLDRMPQVKRLRMVHHARNLLFYEVKMFHESGLPWASALDERWDFVGTIRRQAFCNVPSLGALQVLEPEKGGLDLGPTVTESVLCLFVWGSCVAT